MDDRAVNIEPLPETTNDLENQGSIRPRYAGNRHPGFDLLDYLVGQLAAKPGGTGAG